MKNLFSTGISIFLALSANAQLWDSLQGGLGNTPRVMYTDTVTNYLYAAGMFNEADGIHCKGIARWNGSVWDSLGAGIDGMNTIAPFPQNTFALTRFNNKLYAGGVFSSAGNVAALRVATWDGTVWDSLPVQPFNSQNAYNACVFSLVPVNNDLYMGGIFDTVNGFPCRGIAKWNGGNWSSLGFPNMQFFSSINCISAYNGEIYVGGNFHNSANDTMAFIAKYNGNAWQSVGGGIKGLGFTHIETMCVYNGELYVAGAFSRSAGNAGENIQKWNGTGWSDAGGGTGGSNGQIHYLYPCNGKLYAMGVFNTAGGIAADYLASWDGTNWCSTGSIFDNILDAACMYNDTLIVGGGFRSIDGDSLSYIAQWGGGNFTAVCGNTTGINESSPAGLFASFFPNPVTTTGTFQINGTHQMCVLTLYDQLGREVWSKESEENEVELNAAEIAPGLYCYRIVESGEIKASGKLVIE